MLFFSLIEATLGLEVNDLINEIFFGSMLRRSLSVLLSSRPEHDSVAKPGKGFGTCEEAHEITYLYI